MRSIWLGLCVSVLVLFASVSAVADTLVWRGPTHTVTIGLSEDDIAHIEFPEEIINVTIENQDYVDILVVEGYANRAFRMRSMLPKMATRTFFTGASGKTYIAVLTTDVPYRAFLQIVDAAELDDVARKVAQQFGPHDLIRAMAMEQDIPGILRETHVIPDWFRGAGLSFDLSEVWQSATLTGLVVNVRNALNGPNEVNLPAITIPKTDEWGVLRQASMENMRLAPTGKQGDQGVLYLVFER
jgi:hypothetical protein